MLVEAKGVPKLQHSPRPTSTSETKLGLSGVVTSKAESCSTGPDHHGNQNALVTTAGALLATAVEAGESTEAVPCDFDREGIEIGFNARYLSEFLGAIESDQVELRLTDAKSAGELRTAGGADYRYVVMPMRI